MSLYTISKDTEKELRNFSMKSSRASTMQAMVYQIDQKTYEIKRDDTIEEPVLESFEELEEELPYNYPRYIILSYPLTLKDGRKTSKFVMLYYIPSASDSKSKMIYASATELFKNTANAMKIIDVKSVEDLEDVPDKLQ